MITLYIWNTVKGHSWGHASLELDGRVYISWWPGDLDGRLPTFAENNTFQRDKHLEGYPNHRIAISGLDEREIKRWWMNWRGHSLFYSPLGKNCCTTVAEALQAGGGDEYAKAGGWMPSLTSVWTPNTVLMYAQAIQRGLTLKRAGNQEILSST